MSAPLRTLARVITAVLLVVTGMALSAPAAMTQATSGPTLNWIEWTNPGSFPESSAVIQPNNLPYSFTFAREAVGAITISATAVYVKLTGEIASPSSVSNPSGFGTGNNGYWSSRGFSGSGQAFQSANVPSLPPNGDRIGVVGSSVSAQTLSFYSDAARTVPVSVSNIVMNIWSLGAPGGPGAWDFDRDFSILSDNRTFGAGLGFAKTAPTANTYRLSASEGSGTIQFTGTFNSISWTVTQAEAFAVWNIGVTSVDAPLDVTFDTQGGSTISAQTTSIGGSLSNPGTPTREGDVFQGWFTSATGGTPITFPYAHGRNTGFTLFAQWSSSGLVLPPPQSPTTTLPATTTTPPVTTAPPVTTVPTTTPPAPVPDPSGSLPSLGSTETLVTENGQPIEIELVVEDDSALVLRSQDFELRLRGACTTGCTITENATGRETIHLERSGGARVSGFGFLPGSLVHVWIFSEPRYLGALLVADDGTYEGTFPLEGIDVGEHTLQANGFSFDNLPRSANLGIVVTDDPEPATDGGHLPNTGSGDSSATVAVGVLALGALLLAVSRRRARTA